MNKRQEKIILFLEDSKSWINGKALSQLLNVSDRTIRTDIDSINKEYSRLIESNLRQGYHINQEVLINNDLSIGKLIPQNSTERCVYIMQQLLFNKNEINLTFLQEQVFVSGYSIDNDIKKIKAILKPYDGLRLVRKKNYITLEGNEEEKRKLYKNMLSQETKGNFINMNTIAQLYEGFDLLEVKDILESTFIKYDFSIREDSFPMLMIHIGVAIERMKRHHYIETDYKTKELMESKEYEIAQDFFMEVSKKLYIKSNENEMALIALLLLGKKSGNYTKDIANSKCDIDYDELIDRLINNINEFFGIDFSKDNMFKLGLRLHIQNLIERILNDTLITNVYLSEIKRKYPLVFDMSIYVGKVISDEINMQISEDEMGYLSLHLGSAYDRLNVADRYRAVLIHPNNQALTSMCLRKIEDRFSDRICIENVLNYFEVSVIEECCPDLIISTVPLKHNLNIATINISLFINTDDEFKLFQAINQLDKNRSKKQFMETIQELISEEFFFTDLNCTTPNEVIEYMCDEMIAKKVITSDFKESVLNREEIAATSFNYGFAVPHSLNVSANKTSIAIATLKHQIAWGQYEVRLIILLATNEESRRLLGVFFDWLSNITNDSSKLSRLLETKNRNEFINYILQ